MERACLSADKKERKSYAAKNKRRTGRKDRILENTSERLTDELFGKNLAMYTFSEQCEEVSGRWHKEDFFEYGEHKRKKRVG